MSAESDSSYDTAELTDQEHITAAVAEIVESRTVIDQAKGMLMLVYGIGADAAFELLRWQSQNHNVKIRHLAEQVLSDLAQQHKATPLAQRVTYDSLFLTAHSRIAGQTGTAA